MTNNQPSSQPPTTLNVGDVITASLSIYRYNFKTYYFIALSTIAKLAIFWIFLVLIIYLIYQPVSFENILNILPILVPSVIVLAIYSLVILLAMQGLLSRLAYGEIRQQPESVKDARRYIKGRKWVFFRAAILMSILSLLCFLGLTLVLVPIIWFLSLIIPSQGFISFIFFISLLAYLLLFYRLYIISSLMAMPIAVENEINAIKAIERTWKLTKGFILRLLVIFVVGSIIIFVFTFAVNIVFSILNNIFQIILRSNLTLLIIFNLLVSLPISILIQTISIPFEPILRAVIYYDLRSRKEGIGLNLRKQ